MLLRFGLAKLRCCVPMLLRFLWHRKCLLPSGVHVSPKMFESSGVHVSAKMFESLRRPCVNLHLASRTSHFASKCLSPCGVHVSPKMFLWFCQANMLCCYFVLSDFVASRFLWFCQASLLRASEWTSEWVSESVSEWVPIASMWHLKRFFVFVKLRCCMDWVCFCRLHGVKVQAGPQGPNFNKKT